MKIIDGHIHIGKWGDVFFGYKTTVSQAIDVMKSSGVDEAVCFPADKTRNEDLFSEVIDNKDFKFHFAAWINPQDSKLDKFLDKNIEKISLFKIHPSIQKKRVTDSSFEKYIQIALEKRKPLVVHCGRWKEIASYEYSLELAKNYPDLIVILAHLGGDQPLLYLKCAEEIKKGNFKNIFLGTESVREFYFVNKVVQTVGIEKVIFGSDYNIGLPKMYIPIIDSLNIPINEKELIFSGNISRLLNL